MRSIFGVLSLLLVLVVVGILAKKQLGTTLAAPTNQQNTVLVDQSVALPATSAAAKPQVQIQQIQQQINWSVKAAMEQTRSVTDDAK